MARILLSYYYKMQRVGQKAIHVFWDGLIKELENNGNELYVINTSYFNTYNSNVVKNASLDSLILEEVRKFNPELIITFNHRIPQSILDNFKDIPTIIWDGDELQYFCDLEYIKDNIDRYKLFSIVSSWEKNYLDFGFNKNQIFYIPPATAIRAKNIEQDKNISFLGGVHYSTSKISEIIKKNIYNEKINKIIQEYLNNTSYNYEHLFSKYFHHDLDEYKLKNMDLFPLFNYRILILINLIDQGLVICGDRWDIETYAKLLPQLAAMYLNKRIWTLQENEDFYNSSKISISPIHPQARGCGFPWRIFDVMASNACLVSEQSSDLKNLTKDYVDIPMFHTPWEARELCIDLLNNENKRKDIVVASQEYINKNARWINRFKDIENILNIKIVNLDKKGSVVILAENEEFQKLHNITQSNSLKKLNLKNKIRYKIWHHFDKILKRKQII